MKQFHCAENAFDVTHSVDTSAQGNAAIFAIDLDGDYDIDFLAANTVPHQIAWYENKDESFTKDVITEAAKSATDVFAIDLDDDGDVDVLSASAGDDKIAW